MTLSVLISRDNYEPHKQTIIAIFDDDDAANRAIDLLNEHGDPDKTYRLDGYNLNEIQKGTK